MRPFQGIESLLVLQADHLIYTRYQLRGTGFMIEVGFGQHRISPWLSTDELVQPQEVRAYVQKISY